MGTVHTYAHSNNVTPTFTIDTMHVHRVHVITSVVFVQCVYAAGHMQYETKLGT